MDELFRKAVDQYPLKQCESQWNEILPKLLYESDDIVGNIDNTIKNKSLSVRQILLIIISFSILTTFIKHKELIGPSNTKEGSGVTQEFIPQVKLPEHSFFGYLKDSRYSNSITGLFIKIKKANTGYPLRMKKNSDIPDSNSEEQSTFTKTQGIQKLELASDKMYTVTSFFALTNFKPIELEINNHASDNLIVHINWKSQNRGFYLGINMGPAWSLVEHGKITNPGFDIGMIAGYKINKYVSVETGLFYSRYFYFVSGKYLNQIVGASDARIVEGNRNSFKIPIDLKYNIIQTLTGNLFISAGFTTYVGVNESIQVHSGDNTLRASQSLDYGKANYLPSYVNFSLGFDYKMRKLFLFRIEPYLEFPLSMVAGNTMNINANKGLQVYNMGLHFGLTRLIH